MDSLHHENLKYGFRLFVVFSLVFDIVEITPLLVGDVHCKY